MEEPDPDVRRFLNYTITFFIALVIVVSAILVIQATALNITFADSTLTGNHSIDVISANGSLLNMSHSGDTVEISLADAENDTIIVHYLPASTDGNRFLDRFTSVLDTPDLMFQAIMSYITVYWIPIILLLFLVGLWLRR